MALHSRLVLPDAALRPHCRLLLDAVVEASAQRQLLPDAAVRLHCQQHLPDAALRLLCQQRPAQRLPAQRHPGSAASHPRRRPRPAIASRWHSATVPRPAALPRRACLQHLSCHGAPCQQQTSFGGEEYSGLASNLAHLGRIC